MAFFNFLISVLLNILCTVIFHPTHTCILAICFIIYLIAASGFLISIALYSHVAKSCQLHIEQNLSISVTAQSNRILNSQFGVAIIHHIYGSSQTSINLFSTKNFLYSIYILIQSSFVSISLS